MAPREKIDFLLVALSQVASFVMNLVLIKILTSTLTLQAYGYYTVLTTIILFARQCLYDPMSYVIVKRCGQVHLSKARLELYMGIVGRATDLLSQCLIVAALLMSTIDYFFTKSLTSNGTITACCILLLVSHGAHGLFIAALNITRQRSRQALFSIFDSCIKVIFVLFLPQIIHAQVTEAMLLLSTSALVSYAIVRLYSYPRSGKYKPKRLNNLVKVLYSKSLSFYLPSVMAALKSVSDRWFLATFTNVQELAVFGVFLQLGFSTIIMAFGIIQTFVAPRIYAMCITSSHAQSKLILTYLNRLLLVFCIFALGISFTVHLYGGNLLALVVPESYQSYVEFFPFFVLAGVVAAFTGIVQLVVIGTLSSRVAGWLMFSSVTISLLISVICIANFGFIGGLASLILGNLVVAFAYYAAAVRTLATSAAE